METSLPLATFLEFKVSRRRRRQPEVVKLLPQPFLSLLSPLFTMRHPILSRQIPAVSQFEKGAEAEEVEHTHTLAVHLTLLVLQ